MNYTKLFRKNMLISLVFFAPMLMGLGGHLVGNGAGQVEQNIVFAYISLTKEIDQCFSLPAKCPLDSRDANTLNNIRQIAMDHPFTTDRIQFISESEQPGFFETEVGQAHRIAKTGSVPGSPVALPSDPIFWNTDQFYNASGNAALDFPFIIAILIHELGHQAGEPDHKYLDGLGAKVRSLLQDQIQEETYPHEILNGSEIELKLTTIKYSDATGTTDLFLFDGDHTVSLNRYFIQSVVCKDNETRVGWTLNAASFESNIHQTKDEIAIPYRGWLSVRCLRDGQIREEDLDFTLELRLSPSNGKYHFEKAIFEANE